MTYSEYLAAEAASEVKHEYLGGEVWPLAGGAYEHDPLLLKLALLFEVALCCRQTPGEVLTSARVRIPAEDRATYADIAVVEGEVEPSFDDWEAITNPVLIIELRSRTTVDEDCGKKFRHYWSLPTLREHVTLFQRTHKILAYRRAGDGLVMTDAGPGGVIELASLGLWLVVDRVFDRLRVAP